MLHLDLFSGIGGFSYAADIVFGDVDHIFVEYDDFCRMILKKHWPEAPIYGDIRQFATNTNIERLQGSNNKEPPGITWSTKRVDLLLQISVFYRTTNLTDTKEISKQLIDEADEFIDDILKRKSIINLINQIEKARMRMNELRGNGEEK